MRFSTIVSLLVLAAGALLLPACGSGGLQLPTDPAGTALFEQAQQHMEEERWSKAAEGFDTLLRNYPTSPHLPDARLQLGRAYYEQKRQERYLLAIEAFRNFMTYHPSHAQVDYAQLMVGVSYMGLMRSPDRDQSNTRRALEAFEVFLEDYPQSTYREYAQERLQEVVDTLARHELQVAEWQLDRGLYAAAEARAQYALRKYPSTNHRCELLFTLAESLHERDDRQGAVVYYQQILQEYPSCVYANDARERVDRGGEADGD